MKTIWDKLEKELSSSFFVDNVGIKQDKMFLACNRYYSKDNPQVKLRQDFKEDGFFPIEDSKGGNYLYVRYANSDGSNFTFEDKTVKSNLVMVVVIKNCFADYYDVINSILSQLRKIPFIYSPINVSYDLPEVFNSETSIVNEASKNHLLVIKYEFSVKDTLENMDCKTINCTCNMSAPKIDLGRKRYDEPISFGDVTESCSAKLEYLFNGRKKKLSQDFIYPDDEKFIFKDLQLTSRYKFCIFFYKNDSLDGIFDVEILP